MVSTTEASAIFANVPTLSMILPFLPRLRLGSDVVSNNRFLVKYIPTNKKKADGSIVTSAAFDTASLPASLSTQAEDAK